MEKKKRKKNLTIKYLKLKKKRKEKEYQVSLKKVQISLTQVRYSRFINYNGKKLAWSLEEISQLEYLLSQNEKTAYKIFRVD